MPRPKKENAKNTRFGIVIQAELKEKIKKIAIFFSLNSANALRPNASVNVLALPCATGQAGNVKQ